MSKKNEMQTKNKQELQEETHAERLADKALYQPLADIYETEEAIHILADMAGVDETSVDITLEKNVLTIHGHAAMQAPEGMELVYSEYAVGDYERTFYISNEIDRAGIEAKMADGVLDLKLPKSKELQPRKISVTAA